MESTETVTKGNELSRALFQLQVDNQLLQSCVTLAKETLGNITGEHIDNHNIGTCGEGCPTPTAPNVLETLHSLNFTRGHLLNELYENLKVLAQKTEVRL